MLIFIHSQKSCGARIAEIRKNDYNLNVKGKFYHQKEEDRMQVIKCKTRVDAEGKIILQLPKYLANQELEVAIVYTLANSENTHLHEIVDSFYGCLAEDPILIEETEQQNVA